MSHIPEEYILITSTNFPYGGPGLIISICFVVVSKLTGHRSECYYSKAMLSEIPVMMGPDLTPLQMGLPSHTWDSDNDQLKYY